MRDDLLTIDVAERDFYSLPSGTQQLFRAYGEPRSGPNRDTMRFVMATYRWKEVQASIPKGHPGNGR